MRAPATALVVIAAVLLLAPGWSGEVRLPLLGAKASMATARVPLDPRDPGRRGVGALTYLGGVSLTSPDPAFGGFSAVAVIGERITLLSDGGNIASFRLDARGRAHEARFANLPAGPGSGWEKRDRDSESLVVEAGHAWVGFERANAIWRYAAGFGRAERAVRPAAMRKWRSNGGPEALARLADGRFVAIAEERTHGSGREALLFARDPTEGVPPLRFRYLPPAGFDPSDACALPDGRLLVLNRRWRFPLRFASALVVVDAAALKPGEMVRGREIARLEAPLTHGNFEGVAATVEAGRTMLWLVSDNDQSAFRPSLLLKFRLDKREAAALAT